MVEVFAVVGVVGVLAGLLFWLDRHLNKHEELLFKALDARLQLAIKSKKAENIFGGLVPPEV